MNDRSVAETDPISNALRLAASQLRGGGSSRGNLTEQAKDLFRKIAHMRKNRGPPEPIQ